MYVVICSDKNYLEISHFKQYEMNDNIFGPFVGKYDAEEWVDNHCGKIYWSIVKLNDTTN